jgi:hypothetical protein
LGFLLALNDAGASILRRVLHLTITFAVLIAGMLAGAALSPYFLAAAAVFFAIAYTLGLMGARGTELEKLVLFAGFLALTGFFTPTLLRNSVAALRFAGGNFLLILTLSMLWPLRNEGAFIPYRETLRDLRTRDLHKHLYALVFAVTVLATFLLVETWQLERGYWAIGTVLLIMRPDRKQSVYRGVQRLFGTALAVVLATGVIHFTHHALYLILLISVLSLLMPATLKINYWLSSAVIGLIVLLLMDLPAIAMSGAGAHLAMLRLQATALGCGIAMIGGCTLGFFKAD